MATEPSNVTDPTVIDAPAAAPIESETPAVTELPQTAPADIPAVLETVAAEEAKETKEGPLPKAEPVKARKSAAKKASRKP